MATWLTLDELARYLKKGRSTIYRMARSGHLPSQKVGRTWLFDQEEVDRWIKSKQAGSSSATTRRAQHA
jgi:excisionase family DNA binding protein